LGRALATLALERGDKVIGTFRSCDQAAEFEKSEPGRAIGCEVDLAIGPSIAPALSGAIRRAGERLDIVVNAAGYGLQGAVEEVGEAQLRQVMETNFFGPLGVIRAVMPWLRAQGAGHLVNVSSVGGFVGRPGLGLYCASKFAIEGLSESLRLELAPLGVKVTIVEPGSFRTSWASGSMVFAENPIADYADLEVTVKSALGKTAGAQRGDPDRAAAAIQSCIDSPNPPLRLVVGPDALQSIRGHVAAITADLLEWEELAESTDFG
jgi:NAD(P)-dependent dehydrogenase (short-subunit alcohol dehydrogenase family)